MDNRETIFGKDSRETIGALAVISTPDGSTPMEETRQDEHSHRTFANRFQDFGNSTTFHGLSYVINNKHSGPRRLLWFVIVVAMSTWLIYSVTLSFITYFNYPITSAISINYVDNITFPAVTLCNFNQFRRSTLTEEKLKVLREIYESNPPDEIDFTPFDGETNFDFDENHLLEISHNLDTMLIDCKWKSSQKCTVQNFTSRFTDHGVCFTFNDPEDVSERLQVINAGRDNGLFLRLFAETNEYAFGENTAAGFRILLHSQGLMPLVKEVGISVSPGFESSIAVRKHVFKSLAWPYQSNCTSSQLKYSTIYSVPTCKYECKIKFVVERCGCRDYRWPGTVRFCHPREYFSCILKYEAQYQLQEKHRDCHCPVSCLLTTYDSHISIGYWPSSVWNRSNQSKDVTYTRNNYLDVHIFYEELMYVEMEQKSAYDSSALLSGVGGYMGLLCGMSLITVAEWADFIFISLLNKFKP
ncbi:acid-sensing ion channel 2-like [Patiria miniata]|uniref:Uncharacterized protein n=1 Tax=Patiria miniata TaxID=46514 RepID=A0A913ZVC2_PATMI|nr:acid-sensing ion channel 2-like [Patiria miniata]